MHEKQLCLCISDEMLPQLVSWYHVAMMHVEDMNHLEQTLQRHFYDPEMQGEVQKQVATCDHFQWLK